MQELDAARPDDGQMEEQKGGKVPKATVNVSTRYM